MRQPPRHGQAPRWAARWARHPLGPGLLALFAALEACLFPAPTEALMVALCIGRPRRSWSFAAIALAGSLVGALAGYAAGRFLFDEFGLGLLERAGAVDRFEAVGRAYRDGAFWLLVTSGFTPVPYLVYTLAAGAHRIPLPVFVAGAVAGRAAKYFLLGTATFYLGGPVREFLMRRPALAVAAVLAAAAFLIFVL